MDQEMICRICLTNPSQCISIFTELKLWEKTITLSKMIMACAPIDISKEDGLPSKICEHCLKLLQISFLFRIRIIQADSKLKQYVRKNLVPRLQPISEGFIEPLVVPLSSLDQSNSQIFSVDHILRSAELEIDPLFVDPFNTNIDELFGIKSEVKTEVKTESIENEPAAPMEEVNIQYENTLQDKTIQKEVTRSSAPTSSQQTLHQNKANEVASSENTLHQESASSVSTNKPLQQIVYTQNGSDILIFESNPTSVVNNQFQENVQQNFINNNNLNGTCQQYIQNKNVPELYMIKSANNNLLQGSQNTSDNNIPNLVLLENCRSTNSSQESTQSKVNPSSRLSNLFQQNISISSSNIIPNNCDDNLMRSRIIDVLKNFDENDLMCNKFFVITDKTGNATKEAIGSAIESIINQNKQQTTLPTSQTNALHNHQNIRQDILPTSQNNNSTLQNHQSIIPTSQKNVPTSHNNAMKNLKNYRRTSQKNVQTQVNQQNIIATSQIDTLYNQQNRQPSSQSNTLNNHQTTQNKLPTSKNNAKQNHKIILPISQRISVFNNPKLYRKLHNDQRFISQINTLQNQKNNLDTVQNNEESILPTSQKNVQTQHNLNNISTSQIDTICNKKNMQPSPQNNTLNKHQSSQTILPNSQRNISQINKQNPQKKLIHKSPQTLHGNQRNISSTSLQKQTNILETVQNNEEIIVPTSQTQHNFRNNISTSQIDTLCNKKNIQPSSQNNTLNKHQSSQTILPNSRRNISSISQINKQNPQKKLVHNQQNIPSTSLQKQTNTLETVQTNEESIKSIIENCPLYTDESILPTIHDDPEQSTILPTLKTNAKPEQQNITLLNYNNILPTHKKSPSKTQTVSSNTSRIEEITNSAKEKQTPVKIPNGLCNKHIMKWKNEYHTYSKSVKRKYSVSIDLTEDDDVTVIWEDSAPKSSKTKTTPLPPTVESVPKLNDSTAKSVNSFATIVLESSVKETVASSANLNNMYQCEQSSKEMCTNDINLPIVIDD